MFVKLDHFPHIRMWKKYVKQPTTWRTPWLPVHSSAPNLFDRDPMPFFWPTRWPYLYNEPRENRFGWNPPFVWWGNSSVWESFLLGKMRMLWILCSTWKSQNWMLTHVCIASKVDGFPAPLCISFHTNCLYYQNLWMHTPKSSFVYPLQVKNKKHFLWCRVVPSYFSVAFLSLQSSLHSHLAALCLPVESERCWNGHGLEPW